MAKCLTELKKNRWQVPAGNVIKKSIHRMTLESWVSIISFVRNKPICPFSFKCDHSVCAFFMRYTHTNISWLARYNARRQGARRKKEYSPKLTFNLNDWINYSFNSILHEFMKFFSCSNLIFGRFYIFCWQIWRVKFERRMSINRQRKSPNWVVNSTAS